MIYYIDTGALIALSDKNDRMHETAKTYFIDSVNEGIRYVVGKPVLIEYIDGVTQRIGKKKGIEELKNILSSKIIRIEIETKSDWEKGLEYYNKYKDIDVDLTDSISFAIMERLGLKVVFGFDSRFEVHDFTLVP